jgi:hypothetical protein
LPVVAARPGAYIPAYFIARICANLQRSHEAFVHLEKAYEQRSDWLMDLAVDPAFDGLRNTPRFRALQMLARAPQHEAKKTSRIFILGIAPGL